jgi:lipopolysaccharide/colanic/teichoic acid biosynthesis glycosyltransferase
MIRVFDIFLSITALILASPVFVLISLGIKVDSPGPIFYVQNRVGKGNVDFMLIKFRSMYLNSENKGFITIGTREPRITRLGYYIRKYKLDELPQLLNVLKGDMSLVGPRPEVRKYVQTYSEEQKLVLSVKPGITDYASIKFINENELLTASADPEKTYIDEIIPSKIDLNMIFINAPSLNQYFRIIFLTLKSILN